MVAEVNKILKRRATETEEHRFPVPEGTEIPTGQLTYTAGAAETAVLFRWTPILQHRRCSQEKYMCDGRDGRQYRGRTRSLLGICMPFFSAVCDCHTQ